MWISHRDVGEGVEHGQHQREPDQSHDVEDGRGEQEWTEHALAVEEVSLILRIHGIGGTGRGAHEGAWTGITGVSACRRRPVSLSKMRRSDRATVNSSVPPSGAGISVLAGIRATVRTPSISP